MCVIVVIPANTPFKKDDFKKCWNSNDDGSGFSIQTPNHMISRKGFMKRKKLWQALTSHASKVTKSSIEFSGSCVIHFRWATHGGVSPDMTHPFEIVGKKKEVFYFYHNGIINGFGDTSVSDTADFAKNVLEPLSRSLSSNRFLKATESLSGLSSSRFCFHFADGSYTLYGKGWYRDKDLGIWFSNNTWVKGRIVTYYGKGWKDDTYYDETWWGHDKTISGKTETRTKKTTTKTTLKKEAETNIIPFNGESVSGWRKCPFPSTGGKSYGASHWVTTETCKNCEVWDSVLRECIYGS